MTRHQFAGAAPTVHLTSLIDGAAVSATATESCSQYPDGVVGPFVVCFDRGTASEEKVLCSARTGSVFTITTRGYDGTTATSHSSGATIDHVLDSLVITDHDAHVYDTTRNDHTQYQKSGNVTNARVSCVVVRSSSTVVTLADATTSVISFDTEDIDTDAYHSTSVNTSRLTVPTTGKYRVWGIAEFGASAVGHRAMDVRVNGTTTHGLASTPAGVSADSVPTLNGSIMLALTAADYAELRLYQNSGGALTFNANGTTRFGMEFLGT